ncbi:RNA-directed DNA polymerase from mobile element jockey [Mizuhopecten yessoensis]|uniref:RNA-directed DNA polymerase from mobile element jockey n=1 Tax=Mizuhopecten yessoensis TaxID=6573 RepID=A0A210QBX6_MIZYE|nr:RNA-directed DNA polymerase from mobile element jockey [Mizuhopecten yessoensis]
MLTFPKTLSEYVLWVNFSKHVVNSDLDFLLGCVYIPPENTKYASPEAFNEIEREMIELSHHGNKVAIVGDFNAKTQVRDDFVEPDDNFIRSLNLDENDELYSYLYDIEKLKLYNVPLRRASQCKAKVNNYGNKLLDFCKQNNMYIANGRIGNDAQIGKTTCSDVSVIDYLLLSSDMFRYTTDFEIKVFDPLISDVHCRLVFSLCKLTDECIYNTECHENRYTKWKSCKEQDFVKHILDDERGNLHRINDKLNELLNKQHDNVTNNEINDIVNSISELFKGSAKQVFGSNNAYRKRRLRCDNKPWFNRECHLNRVEFNKAKALFHKVNNPINKTNLNRASKVYRKTLNKNYRNYQEKLSSELRNTARMDSKKFWNILNKCDGSVKKGNADICITELYEYFKDLNKSVYDDDDFELENPDNSIFDDYLNGEITTDEIKFSLINLKNSKASGIDQILNEYLKSTMDVFLPIYQKIFNLILNTASIPDVWKIGIIKPVYKNKGDPKDPDNYRAITLVSCLGKVFTSVINNRLNKISDEFDLISSAQAGFRKGHSTTDNMFVLYSLISIYFSLGKKLYCTFIDFSKAFDSVWRVGLWKKLQKSNITGKIFNIIYKLYDKTKSCVKNGCEQSDLFNCEIGLKQGENLSPFLFAIYLNDLETYLVEKNVNCLQTIDKLCIDNIGVYLKLFIILYADDTVLFSETPDGLQLALNEFEQYCNTWKLTINSGKTKIVIFSKRKCARTPHFTLCNVELEILEGYTYLGLFFNFSCSFFKARKKIVEQAQKSVFAVYKKLRNISLPVDLQLKIFDSLIMPVLLYSSEIWGFENTNIIEKIHLQFCKYILNVRKSTPNFIVYGELGRYPLDIEIKCRIIVFWHKLITSSKLSSTIYKLMYTLHENGTMLFKWLAYVKDIFSQTGLNYVWYYQSTCSFSKDEIKRLVKSRLKDQFIQKWFDNILNSSRGQTYSILKTKFEQEKYLIKLNTNDRKIMCKFRSCNMHLPIEKGRWLGIPRQERTCTLCNLYIGDEFHYLFICESVLVKCLREKYIPKYYFTYPSQLKMQGLFNIFNVKIHTKLCKFIEKLEKILT